MREREEVLKEFDAVCETVAERAMADEIVRLREALAAKTRVQITDAMREAGARALCEGFRATHRDGDEYAPYDRCTEQGKNVWRGLANLTLFNALTAALEGPRDQ
jgi:hypothetical protein